LASNQVQYSLLHRHPERDGVFAACRELGITLIAYMPLASGALTGKYSASHRPAGWRRYMPVFRDVARLDRVNTVLAELARRHGATQSQIALRWLIQQDNVLPIPARRTARRPPTTSVPSSCGSPMRRWTSSAGRPPPRPKGTASPG
jgi:aryl-alcohol dehydrogenase-like predicted oxidoreductase